MRTLFLTTLVATCSSTNVWACRDALSTPNGITYCSSQLGKARARVRLVDPEQIDAAWDAAMAMAGGPSDEPVTLTIAWESKLFRDPYSFADSHYAGLTHRVEGNVYYVTVLLPVGSEECLFGSINDIHDSHGTHGFAHNDVLPTHGGLLHELLHVAIGARSNGYADMGHRDPAWRQVPEACDRLFTTYCRW